MNSLPKSYYAKDTILGKQVSIESKIYNVQKNFNGYYIIINDNKLNKIIYGKTYRFGIYFYI